MNLFIRMAKFTETLEKKALVPFLIYAVAGTLPPENAMSIIEKVACGVHDTKIVKLAA